VLPDVWLSGFRPGDEIVDHHQSFVRLLGAVFGLVGLCLHKKRRITMATMRAAVFVEKNRIVLEDKPVPEVGPLDALIRITTTTICGTDVHILRGEYPVAKGLTVGHEPVGVIERLGSQVRGFVEGQRVIAGAVTPSGQSYACL
jgi:hypothetical protein